VPTRSVLSTLAVVLLLAAPEAAPSGNAARTFLATAFGATPDEIARIDAGQVVARTLDVRHSREVATLGIVRIRTTPELYVERLTDIVRFKNDEAILQIGTFGAPPQSADVAALTLDEADVRRIRECRVERCGVQLPADAIERFGKHVDWRAADVQQQATRVMQHILLEYVGRYLAVGSPAVMEYADNPARLNVRREFAALVEADGGTWRYLPELHRHLTEYPGARTQGATDLVYWSKERVNRRPVISVTHLSIVPAAGESPVDYAIASKQIYAMHYFDASLGLTLLVRDRSTSSPVTYVVYLNRSRIDLFDGMLGGIARKIVSGKARSLVAVQLARLQRTLASSPMAAP
jgi:hypothetical protein